MKSIKTLLFVIFPLIAVVFASFFALFYFTGYEIHRDVSYGEKTQNKMDIYLPREAYEGGERGFVLFIHGGSWSGGDKSEEAARCRLFASRGYIAATMNYTLRSNENAEDYSVFSVLDEIDSALSAVKDFAAERGIRLTKAAISGYSAGAHLALLYSYSGGERAPLEIAFAASMAGPTEVSEDIWGVGTASRIGALLTGEQITEEMLRGGDADELLASVSPTHYVTGNTPPTLILQGEKDTTVPPMNARSLFEKLSENSVPAECIFLTRSDHSLMQNPIGHLRFYRLMLEWCKEYFDET